MSDSTSAIFKPGWNVLRTDNYQPVVMTSASAAAIRVSVYRLAQELRLEPTPVLVIGRASHGHRRSEAFQAHGRHRGDVRPVTARRHSAKPLPAQWSPVARGQGHAGAGGDEGGIQCAEDRGPLGGVVQGTHPPRIYETGFIIARESPGRFERTRESGPRGSTSLGKTHDPQ